MAEDNNEEIEEQADGSGKKKIILFAGVGLLILGLGIGGTAFFLGGKNEPVAEGEEMVEEEMMEEEIMEASIYHDLHPAFVANFSGQSKKKYMQVYVVALAKEQKVIDDLKLHMPAVRNNILMTLSQKTSDEVATVEGKEMLRKEVLETVRSTMLEKTGKEGVEDLYFTKFVAQ